MSDPTEIAIDFLMLDYDEWPGRAFEQLTEDAVICPSTGRVYVGHEGFTLLFRELARTTQYRSFELAHAEDLGDGWVLAVGATTIHSTAGESFRQPGAWLVRVREDGRVAALLYHRTERDARAAVGMPPGGEPPGR